MGKKREKGKIKQNKNYKNKKNKKGEKRKKRCGVRKATVLFLHLLEY
jgi:hypothetical protein